METRSIRTLLLSGALVLTAAGDSFALEERVVRLPGELVDAYVPRGFSGEVKVAQGEEALFTAVRGPRNSAAGNPIVPDLRYLIGSVTKQFAAAGVLRLAETGALRLDEPLTGMLPGVPHAEELTLHRLLSHTSGLVNFTDLPEFWERYYGQPSSLEDLIALVAGKPLRFAPGTSWEYCNTGYLLAGFLIEKASGRSFGEFLRSDVLELAGMELSAYEARPTLDDFASPHVLTRDYEPFAIGPVGDVSWTHAAGGMYSTAADLHRWNQALESGRVIAPASLARMRTPVREGYGYGVISERIAGTPVIWHDGGLPGFTSFNLWVPESGTSVIVLSNSSGGATTELGMKLTELTLTGQTSVVVLPDPIDVPIETLERYVGGYSLAPDQKVQVTREERRLYLQVASQPQFRMIAYTPGKFYLRFDNVEIEFPGDGAAPAPELLIRQRGRVSRATRMP